MTSMGHPVTSNTVSQIGFKRVRSPPTNTGSRRLSAKSRISISKIKSDILYVGLKLNEWKKKATKKQDKLWLILRDKDKGLRRNKGGHIQVETKILIRHWVALEAEEVMFDYVECK